MSIDKILELRKENESCFTALDSDLSLHQKRSIQKIIQDNLALIKDLEQDQEIPLINSNQPIISEQPPIFTENNPMLIGEQNPIIETPQETIYEQPITTEAPEETITPPVIDIQPIVTGNQPTITGEQDLIIESPRDIIGEQEIPEPIKETPLVAKQDNSFYTEVGIPSTNIPSLSESDEDTCEQHSLGNNELDLHIPFDASKGMFRAVNGIYTDSVTELTINNLLATSGMECKYNRTMQGTVTPGKQSPKFSFFDRNGNIIIWEILSYDPFESENVEKWNRTKLWYQNNGFSYDVNFFMSFFTQKTVDSSDIYQIIQMIKQQL